MVVRSALSAEFSTDVGQAVMDQVPHERVRGLVVGEPALVAAGDEAHPSQEGQLMTRDGEGEIVRTSEVADRQLIVRERVHERYPDWIREEFEDLHRLHEHLGRGEPVAGRLDLGDADDCREHALQLT